MFSPHPPVGAAGPPVTGAQARPVRHPDPVPWRDGRPPAAASLRYRPARGACARQAAWRHGSDADLVFGGHGGWPVANIRRRLRGPVGAPRYFRPSRGMGALSRPATSSELPAAAGVGDDLSGREVVRPRSPGQAVPWHGPDRSIGWLRPWRGEHPPGCGTGMQGARIVRSASAGSEGDRGRGRCGLLPDDDWSPNRYPQEISPGHIFRHPLARWPQEGFPGSAGPPIITPPVTCRVRASGADPERLAASCRTESGLQGH